MSCQALKDACTLQLGKAGHWEHTEAGRFVVVNLLQDTQIAQPQGAHQGQSLRKT